MYRLKKINVLSLANAFAVIYFVIGIFLSVTLFVTKEYPVDVQSYFGSAGEFIFIFLFPFIYALSGFLSGAIISFLYNQSVRFTKGIALDLVAEKKK